MKRKLLQLVATGLYTGYSPLVPGTTGSIPAWLIAFYIIRDSPPVMAAVIIVTFLLSVWSAGHVEEDLGHDSKKIVIDEWVGMFIALIFIPFSLTSYLIAFIAFRFFDVVKIPPAKQAEKLPLGWGVTLDDVIAGIQANIVTQIILFVLDRWQ